MIETEIADKLGIPMLGLKESIHNLEVLYKGSTGEVCPRCEGKEFNKSGFYKYKGKKYPKKICRDCGHSFSIVDFQNNGSTCNRAARILNLDDKKVYDRIDDALQFGLIKKIGDDMYTVGAKPSSKTGAYHKIPLYHYLIETVGFNLRRGNFENALKSHPDTELASISLIKRDTLWRRYQEIAVEIFVCEKLCKFSRTCKKNHYEREECDVVKKTREKPSWKVDIEL